MEIAVSFLTPFAAYLVPGILGGSGILATVAAGMYIGERRSTILAAGTRLSGTSTWDVVTFLLNGALFIMTGLELRRDIAGGPARSLVLLALAAAGTIILARMFWCPLSGYGFRPCCEPPGGHYQIPARHWR